LFEQKIKDKIARVWEVVIKAWLTLLFTDSYEVIKGKRLKFLKNLLRNWMFPKPISGTSTKAPNWMENISYHVASGNIDKELLGEIMDAFLNYEMDSEPLKLKILDAIVNEAM